MNDNSTISWMIMGGPRYDEHSQAELDQRRALREQHVAGRGARSNHWFSRLAAALDPSNANPAGTLTVNDCTTSGC